MVCRAVCQDVTTCFHRTGKARNQPDVIVGDERRLLCSCRMTTAAGLPESTCKLHDEFAPVETQRWKVIPRKSASSSRRLARCRQPQPLIRPASCPYQRLEGARRSAKGSELAAVRHTAKPSEAVGHGGGRMAIARTCAPARLGRHRSCQASPLTFVARSGPGALFEMMANLASPLLRPAACSRSWWIASNRAESAVDVSLEMRRDARVLIWT